ncbi:carbohydrate ABC transporter permease [Lachnospiraceae bacterium oral taxon 500]|nr:carbohydrate ABC transporter permease [Lachnospiraceae bacterium oral taxon 500]
MVAVGIIITILSLYPIYYVVIASLSRPLYVDGGEVMFWLKSPTIASYVAAAKKPGIWTAYANTIFYTAAGVLVNMFFTATMAYALSKKQLIFKKFFTLLTVFTLWFNAGIIPTYVNFVDFNLIDTRAAILFGFAINTYNLIILKSFFEQLPESIEEAAIIDGARNLSIFWRIYLPLSKPALATVGMFYAVTRWNGYFWAMSLLTSDTKVPLQVFLKKMIVDKVSNETDSAILTAASLSSPTTVIYATIVISIIPMLIVYPFVQKYFKSGATIGAVKG